MVSSKPEPNSDRPPNSERPPFTLGFLPALDFLLP